MEGKSTFTSQIKTCLGCGTKYPAEAGQCPACGDTAARIEAQMGWTSILNGLPVSPRVRVNEAARSQVTQGEPPSRKIIPGI